MPRGGKGTKIFLSFGSLPVEFGTGTLYPTVLNAQVTTRRSSVKGKQPGFLKKFLNLNFAFVCLWSLTMYFVGVNVCIFF